jgi:hypothetical protein
MKTGIISWLVLGAALAATVGRAEAPAVTKDYAQEIAAWRASRTAQLTKADGWLTLIGLNFLKVGENTLGSAKDNMIIIAKGPTHLGTVTLAEDGRAKVVFNPGLNTQVNGEAVLAADLRDDTRRQPTTVNVGSISFLMIERGGKEALRIRDSEAESRTHFLGIDYFPVDPSWRIEAQWVPFKQPREVPIHDILGHVSPALILGKAVFTREGHTIELLPIQDDPDGILFFVISDLTSGNETYAAARFLYAAAPVDGKVILDFNKAQNPPCAFTSFATCPLPPKENHMPIAVTAGEKKYRGHAD